MIGLDQPRAGIGWENLPSETLSESGLMQHMQEFGVNDSNSEMLRRLGLISLEQVLGGNDVDTLAGFGGAQMKNANALQFLAQSFRQMHCTTLIKRQQAHAV